MTLELQDTDNPIGPLKTSVVVVTKDRPTMLANLLRSLTKQTVMPDEVLVVDNNSTQSYALVFADFKDKLPLRTVVEMKPGIPAARNRGIHEATGDIILFTDDDCEADREWVQRMSLPFYRNPYIGAVGGEILSETKAGTLVEEFCVAETLMRMGREDGA
jgi:glycosyltransferase involved in cell wall biosynthesis